MSALSSADVSQGLRQPEFLGRRCSARRSCSAGVPAAALEGGRAEMVDLGEATGRHGGGRGRAAGGAHGRRPWGRRDRRRRLPAEVGGGGRR